MCPSFPILDRQRHIQPPTIKWRKIHMKIRIIDHKLVTILSSSSMCEAMLSTALPTAVLPPMTPHCCQASKLAAAAALPSPLSLWCYHWCRAIVAALLPRCLPPPLCCRAATWSAWEHLGELGRAWEASERLGEQVSLLVGELAGGQFLPWPTHTAFGRNRNPEESSGFQRNPE